MNFLNSTEARYFLQQGKASEETIKTAANVRSGCDELFCELVAATTHLGNIDSHFMGEMKRSKSKVDLTIFLQKIDSKLKLFIYKK